MYKNPQTSTQAKRLREIAATFGAQLSHSQSLEVLARLEGHRTLHVAQARNNAGVDIWKTAQEQAAALMFIGYGPFEDDVPGLYAALCELTRLYGTGQREAAKNLFNQWFMTVPQIGVSAAYHQVAIEELSLWMDDLTQKLAAVLSKAAGAPAPADETRYKGPMCDWRLQAGVALEDLPPEHRRSYVQELNRQGHRVYLDVLPDGVPAQNLAGQAQLTAIVEVNEGVPCVHLSNDVSGDTVLTVYATADGLYLAPYSTEATVRSSRPAEDTPAMAQLRDDLEAAYSPEIASRMLMNHVFLKAPNL